MFLHPFRAALVAATAAACIMQPLQAFAQETTAPDTAAMLRQMQQQLEDLRRQMTDRDKELEALRQEVKALREAPAAPAPAPAPAAPASPTEALERAVQRAEAKQPPALPSADHLHEPATPALLSTQVGQTNLRLIDVSLDLLVAAGGSTASNDELETLQGGGHDPRRRGFTFQNAELSLIGAVDPYFTAESHIIFFIDPLEGETVVELEEAFLTTQSLPWGLQARVGQFFTPFGLINPQHPHAWDWLDVPIINARVFGPDGMRGVGAQINYLTPLPWYSEVKVGMQNAEGETMASFNANDEFFEERPIGGRPFAEPEVHSLEDLLYFARWANSVELSDELTLGLGASGAWGPNATGPDADTFIYGGDVKVSWQPPGQHRGWPFVTWQAEYIRRDYDAAAGMLPGADEEFGTIDDIVFPADELADWGISTQLLYGFVRNWAVGLRYEYVTGEGDSVDEDGAFISHDDDPFRAERHRISPMLLWQATEFSRIRLQYNYDEADYLEDGEAHSVWVGFEVLFGAHPAHRY